MTRSFRLLLPGLALIVQASCFGGSASSGQTRHTLPECGIALELPSHFGQPTHSAGCAYDWTGDGGMTLLSVAAALPGDTGQETDEGTAMPGQVVDYARAATFGGFPGRERRTQQEVGAQNRAVWTGYFQGPKGALNIKVATIQKESADEFGEPFWQNIRSRWIQALK